MKKTIAMLLVAMLTVGSVFAAFSGSADVELGVNLDSKDYGFLSQGTGFSMGFELASAEGENVGEGDVYASIKGSMILEVFRAGDSSDSVIPGGSVGVEFPEDAEKAEYEEYFSILTIPAIVHGDWDGHHYVGLGIDIEEAKIAGSNWYLSILGIPGEPDFAKSAIDTWKAEKKSYGVVVDKDGSTKNATVAMEYYNDSYGLELGIADYVVGGNLLGNFDKETITVNGYFMTPEYDMDGLTLQVGAAGALEKGKSPVKVDVSGKVGYATDELSLSVASDIVMGIPTGNDDFAFDMDIAAKAAYDFITVDGYYATDVKVNKDQIENLLSVKAAFDLNAFDLPLSITAGVKDAINRTNIFGEVETSVDALTLTLSADFDCQKDNDWNVDFEASYALDFGTISGAVGYGSNELLSASIEFETTTLVPGATLTFGWADADDLLDKNAKETNYGKIFAACSLEF